MINKTEAAYSRPSRLLLEGLFSPVSNREDLAEFRLIWPNGFVRQVYRPIREPLSIDGHLGCLEFLRAHSGVANIYYGVCPRIRSSGDAESVACAVSVWADELKRPLPVKPSAVVETSPGKYQGLWFLDQPATDLERVESLNRRMGAAVGGDAVHDRARVLRLPGFPNLKYADRPLATLKAFEPDLRFHLDELDAVLPPLPTAATRQRASGSSRRTSRLPPDWLALVFDAICDSLQIRGHRLRQGQDGAVITTCPLHDDHHPSLSVHPERGWICFAGCGKGRLTALAAKLGVRVPGASRDV